MNNSPEIGSKSLDIEYHISTILPTLWAWWSLDVLKTFEKQDIPKSTEKLLEVWTKLIESQVRYDAMNYALMKEFPIDSEQGGWIDKLSISELSMSPEQSSLLIKTLWEYKKQYEKGSVESTNINLLILALKKRNFQEFVTIIIEMPSLQKYLLSDEKFSKNWMQLYEKKWIPELIKMWIWNCKTLAVMSQKILETGNSRWNLWINKIQIIEWEDNHITLKLYTAKWIIDYDPMQILYKKNPTK